MSEVEGDVLSSCAGAVLVLAINNPERRNIITPRLFHSLNQMLQCAAADNKVGAVVLTGVGSYFCAGGDLKQLAERRQLSVAQRREKLEGLNGIVRMLRDFPKPVIAAVEGGAAGAGWSIALACDLIVAARDARFSVAYVKVGLTPDGGITALLAQALPRQLYTQLCLSGEPIDAPRLAALGVINLIAEPGSADRDALQWATALAAGPAKAMQKIKCLCREAVRASLDEQIERESEFMVEAQGSEESAEGIGAFLAKRPPNFARLRSNS